LICYVVRAVFSVKHGAAQIDKVLSASLNLEWRGPQLNWRHFPVAGAPMFFTSISVVSALSAMQLRRIARSRYPDAASGPILSFGDRWAPIAYLAL
jgi:hypothetical protein